MECGVWLRGLILEMWYIFYDRRIKKKYFKISGNLKK